MTRSLRTCARCHKPTSHYVKFCSHNCRLRYWSRPDGDCWIWQGNLNREHKHRGQITVEGKTQPLAAYVAGVAGVTKDQSSTFFPSCGEPLCCNPAHAGLVKRFTRMAPDPVYKKLRPEQVLAIYGAMDTNPAGLARLYGVHPTSIRNIWRGRTYAALTGHDKKGSQE